MAAVLIAAGLAVFIAASTVITTPQTRGHWLSLAVALGAFVGIVLLAAGCTTPAAQLAPGPLTCTLVDTPTGATSSCAPP
jgi:hypothetical protein